MPEHHTYSFSKSKILWDHTIYPGNYTIGGLFQVSNLSSGYHGILKQWWDYYKPEPNIKVLLISENNKVKGEFQQVYPTWNISTIDNHPEISTINDVDIKGDICNQINPILEKYDLIINQATLEHVYNPFQAMQNLIDSLDDGGILLTHTHPPNQEYHQYPRDYFRFMIDWWIDLPKYIGKIELKELYMHNNAHVFSCYQKHTSVKKGWLVNDCLSCIPGTKTFWNFLLTTFPNLEDRTGISTGFSILADKIERELMLEKPDYIIRNGTYFRKLNTDIPTISLIQDICVDDDQQLDVINNSSVAVFNSEYVYEKYRSQLSNKPSIQICPVGVDFNFFKPTDERHPDVLPNSILFIGAANYYPKGFPIVMDIMETMKDQNFCLIMKDNFSIEHIPEHIRNRVCLFNRVDQKTVRCIINSCIAALCTSYEETQHLAGIECAACNIPIVARAVGVYYDNRNNQEWGLIAEDDDTFVEKLIYVRNNLDKFHPRDCFIKQYSLDVWKKNWKKIIDTVC